MSEPEAHAPEPEPARLDQGRRCSPREVPEFEFQHGQVLLPSTGMDDEEFPLKNPITKTG